MTHSTLLLLASSNVDSHLVTLYAREARELVSAHERLLEERDALRAQIRGAQSVPSDPDAQAAELRALWDAERAAGKSAGEIMPILVARNPAFAVPLAEAVMAGCEADLDSMSAAGDALSARTEEAERKLGTAMRAGAAMSEAHEEALARASAAESELVRMSERMEAMREALGALVSLPAHARCRAREFDDAMSAGREALRSLVSGETNDKEKTR